MTADVEPSADSLAMLYRLQTQLRILVSALMIAPDSFEVSIMFGRLVDTADHAMALLAAVEPDALAAIRRAFGYAQTHQHNESTSELVHASGRLAMLLHRQDGHLPPASR